MMAARYSDRYDEFEKTLDGGGSLKPEDWYEDDALHYFAVFRDAINEAHREVARLQALPDVYAQVSVSPENTIDLTTLSPSVYQVKEVLTETRARAVGYVFQTKNVLEVTGGAVAGDCVQVYYHYIPDDLANLDDKPAFSDAVVEPMVYVSLAVARMWQSEKKMEFFSYWYNQYREHLRNVRSSLRASSKRRIPRRLFR